MRYSVRTPSVPRCVKVGLAGEPEQYVPITVLDEADLDELVDAWGGELRALHRRMRAEEAAEEERARSAASAEEALDAAEVPAETKETQE